MADITLESVLEQAEQLPPADQLRLVAILADLTRQRLPETDTGYSWLSLKGRTAYPLFGEEAQDWGSRTRRDGTESRESQWRNEA